jgi:hypothetical protein
MDIVNKKGGLSEENPPSGPYFVSRSDVEQEECIRVQPGTDTVQHCVVFH